MAPITRAAAHIGTEPLLGAQKEGKDLSDSGFPNRSAEATLDELAWRARALERGRIEEAKAAESAEVAR